MLKALVEISKNPQQQQRQQQDNSAYNELVDESSVIGTPTVVHGNTRQYEERYDKPNTNETTNVNNQETRQLEGTRQVEEDGSQLYQIIVVRWLLVVTG